MNNVVRRRSSDYLLSLAVFILAVFGLVMIYSVSKYFSLDKTGGLTDKYYLTRQAIFFVIGAVCWFFFQAVDYRFWQRHAAKLLYLTFILLLLPFILAPFMTTSDGMWINLGFFNFQPSEFAKLSFLIYLAAWFAKNTVKNEVDFQKITVPFLVIMAIIALLMLFQGDLGTLMIFLAISFSVFLVAGASYYSLVSAGLLILAAFWIAIKIEPYRMQRLLTFINPEGGSLTGSYHIRNSLIAIGSGGIWGLGFGQSMQKYLYLPAAHTDSIFAIICEELGMLRSSVVILLFIFIALRGLKIAKRAVDPFGRYLASGIVVWIFIQMIINIGGMFSIMPMTGVPLPFISYGGTSLVANLIAFGILINISKYQNIERI